MKYPIKKCWNKNRMTLQNLYSLQIIFRLARLVLIFLAAVDAICIVIRLLDLDFSRGLLIDATFVALYIVLLIISTNIIKYASDKISHH